MDAIIVTKVLITKYFESWRNYDINLLQEIFDPSAKYCIKNKKRVYNGIEEIVAYWNRNKDRQRNLSLMWNILKCEKMYGCVSFHAVFFDIEEKNTNIIDGIIRIHVSENNRIVVLSEEYSKTDIPNQLL